MYAVTVIDTSGQVRHAEDCPDLNAAKRSANTNLGGTYSLLKVNQHDARVLDMWVHTKDEDLHVLIQAIGDLQDDFSDIVARWDAA